MLPVLLTLLLFLRTHGLWQQGEDWRKPFRRVIGFLDRPLNLKACSSWGFSLLWPGCSSDAAAIRPGFRCRPRTEAAVLPGRDHVARPREKEFMIGHPAFFLAAWAAWKNCHLVLRALRHRGRHRTGQCVQTFAHMRSPILMSYVRALDGYAVGLVLAGCLGIFALAYPHTAAFYEKRRNPRG